MDNQPQALDDLLEAASKQLDELATQFLIKSMEVLDAVGSLRHYEEFRIKINEDVGELRWEVQGGQTLSALRWEIENSKGV